MVLLKRKPSAKVREGKAVEALETPDMRDIRAFCLVVDLGSITAAGEALCETKGSVSRRLSRLEETLGVSLLRRSPRLVQPTEDGVAYRERIGRALELFDDANAALRHAREAPRGHLRVTAPNDLAVSSLGPVVARFMEKFPEVIVDMVLSERRLDFETEQIDVAIRASAALEDSSLVAHRLRDLDGRLYASRAYLKTHGTPRTPDDLASHRLLAISPMRAGKTIPLRRKGDPHADPTGVRATIPLVATNPAFVLEAAAAGAGIATLPSELGDRAVEAGRLCPVLPDHVCFDGALFLIHLGGRFLPPKVRAFRDHVLTELGRPR